MCLQALHLLENAIIFDGSAVIPLQSSVFGFLAPTKFVFRVRKVKISLAACYRYFWVNRFFLVVQDRELSRKEAKT